MKRPTLALCATALSGTLVGCVTLPKDAGLHDVQDDVRQRSGFTIDRIPTDAEEQVVERVRDLLREELSDSRAVEVALLGNRRLQATLQELGIARAELWQAGLPRNPILGGEIRFPGRSSAPFEISLVQEVLDLIWLPQRRKLASAVFEQTKLRVAAEVFDLVTEVRGAYFTAQAASQMATMRRAVADAARIAADLAIRQHKAGNISDLELENEQALFEQAKLDLVLGEEEELLSRERLNSLLGLWGDLTQWRMAPRLPDPPAEEPDLAGLESLAASQRLDLAVARREIEVATRALPLARSSAFELEAGVHREKEPEGTTTTGPALEVSLPVFDRGGAGRSRARAVLAQAEQRYAALAVEVRSEVRAARHRMLSARARSAYHRDVVLPRRSRIVNFSQQEYNFMLIGVFQLLQAKRDEITAQGESIEALRDYWIARSELERAVGGRLTPAAQGSTANQPAVEPQKPNEDHDHGGRKR